MYKKGYFLIITGRRITGDIQALYRESEMAKMIDNLRDHPDKIPARTRDDMMEMFNHAWEETLWNIDGEIAFKQNMATIAFDNN